MSRRKVITEIQRADAVVPTPFGDVYKHTSNEALPESGSVSKRAVAVVLCDVVKPGLIVDGFRKIRALAEGGGGFFLATPTSSM